MLQIRRFFRIDKYEQYIEAEPSGVSKFSCTCMDFTLRGAITKTPCKHLKKIIDVLIPKVKSDNSKKTKEDLK